MKIDSSKYPMPGRFRHHTASHLYLPYNELKSNPEYYPTIFETINWNGFFLNGKKPDCLDVGCGKGIFLLNYAELHPEHNILGLEIRNTPVCWLNEIIKGENIPNVAVIWYNVLNKLEFIENNSIENIFYLFPDPWFKRKHIKRRAFNRNVLENYSRVLKTGGKIFLATDVREVYNSHLKILKEQAGFSFRIIESDEDWNLPITNKEIFCREKSIEIYRIVGTKI